jgi:hypothetical protein
LPPAKCAYVGHGQSGRLCPGIDGRGRDGTGDIAVLDPFDDRRQEIEPIERLLAAAAVRHARDEIEPGILVARANRLVRLADPVEVTHRIVR